MWLLLWRCSRQAEPDRKKTTAEHGGACPGSAGSPTLHLAAPAHQAHLDACQIWHHHQLAGSTGAALRYHLRSVAVEGGRVRG